MMIFTNPDTHPAEIASLLDSEEALIKAAHVQEDYVKLQIVGNKGMTVIIYQNENMEMLIAHLGVENAHELKGRRVRTHNHGRKCIALSKV